MSKISEFYGIKICAQHDEEGPHQVPHFLASYGEFEAVFSSNGRHIIGKMPKTAKKLVKTWALENKEMLHHAWSCAVTHPFPVLEDLNKATTKHTL